MGTDNFASGNFMFPNLPLMASGIGVATPFGNILPPGSKVAAYVRGSGGSILQATGEDEFLNQMLMPTLAAGLKRARSGYGDVVYVLPGHTENITDNTGLTGLLAGTKIIGCGFGANMPKIRWTNTAASWLVNVNDVFFSGLHLACEGANGITKAINVTGSGCGFFGCDIEIASGATAKSAIALEVGTGANGFQFRGNIVRGTETHNVTDGIKVVAAVTDLCISDNEMIASATSANGLVHFTAAALRLKVFRNVIYNTHTSAVAGLAFDNVASDGIVHANMIGCKSTGTITSGTTGIGIAGSSVLVEFFNNYVVNDKAVSGILMPTADT